MFGAQAKYAPKTPASDFIIDRLFSALRISDSKGSYSNAVLCCEKKRDRTTRACREAPTGNYLLCTEVVLL
jgi:hypothetical protein